MGAMSLGLLIVGTIVCLLAGCLGLAILWEILNIFRDRRAYNLTLRRHEEATRARKAGPDAGGIVWDRELDG
jgi:hypothetical protein